MPISAVASRQPPIEIAHHRDRLGQQLCHARVTMSNVGSQRLVAHPNHPQSSSRLYVREAPAERVRLRWTHNRARDFHHTRHKQTGYTFTFLPL